MTDCMFISLQKISLGMSRVPLGMLESDSNLDTILSLGFLHGDSLHCSSPLLER